jgi:ferredoxin
MPMKISIDAKRCQGHGRCYDLAPELFGEDEEGYGVVLRDGIVAPDTQAQARLAVLNCPESAIDAEEGE